MIRTWVVGFLASLLALAVAPANAAVTAAEIRQFADENRELDGKDTPRQGTIHRLVRKTRDVPAAASELAKAWRLPEPVATQLIEGLILVKYHAWPEPPEHREARGRALMRAAALAAPTSRELWKFLFEFFDGVDASCADTEIRDAYFAQPFALELFGYDPPCYDWLPTLARLHPGQLELRYELVDYLSSDYPATALAASGWLVDDLDARGVPLDGLAIQAVRVYWSQLAEAGLGDVLLADAARREADLDRILGSPPMAVKKGGADIVDERRASYHYELARNAYALALIDAGRLDEARSRIAKYHIDSKLAADSVALDPNLDVFDRYFADRDEGVYWKAMTDSALSRRVAARFLAAHQYPEPAEELGRTDCRYATDAEGPARDEAAVKELPEAYTTRRAKYTALVAQRTSALGCKPAAAAAGPAMSSRLPSYAESPLTAAEIRRAPLPALGAKFPLPQSFHPVRAEKLGSDILVVCLSSAVDPGGEVSGGGYWLMRSPDDGHTWKDPLYLGFQEHGPYVVHETGRVPMHWGDMLRLEVDVSELDPDSITFPPVGLRARREAKDVIIDLPLAALERDTDHDGWPDLLEAKLRTDPANADTDGDGVPDKLDDFPQASARGTPHRFAGIVTDMLAKLAGYEGAGIIEPMRPDSGSAPQPLAAMGGRASTGSYLFTFIQGDRAMFTGLRAGGGQVIVVDDDDVTELRAMSGPIFPLQFPTIIADPQGRRAAVQWSAGWTGGTLLYTLKDGKWTSKEISRWITRDVRPASSTFPG